MLPAKCYIVQLYCVDTWSALLFPIHVTYHVFTSELFKCEIKPCAFAQIGFVRQILTALQILCTMEPSIRFPLFFPRQWLISLRSIDYLNMIEVHAGQWRYKSPLELCTLSECFCMFIVILHIFPGKGLLVWMNTNSCWFSKVSMIIISSIWSICNQFVSYMFNRNVPSNVINNSYQFSCII